MSPTYHCLEINLRVPIRVVENDNVGGREIDAESTSSRTQQEDKLGTVWHVECFYRPLGGTRDVISHILRGEASFYVMK